MATTTGRGSSVKRRDEAGGDEAVQVVRDQVEELARLGARQMLLAALEDEVNVYLQRDRYQRQGEFRGYRNGTTPRRLTLGSGTVPLEVPRVRHPAGPGAVRIEDRAQVPASQRHDRGDVHAAVHRRPGDAGLRAGLAAAGGERRAAVAQHDQSADTAVPRRVRGVRPAGSERPEVRLYLGGRDLPEGRAGYGESLPDGADRGGYGGAEALALAAEGYREAPRAGASC
ncbi:MAG: transposase [Phycisphaerales bacterium]|nr:transposase [Phycisphaerales bacterium]